MKTETISRQDVFIKMALDAWNAQLSRVNKTFDSLTNEQLNGLVSNDRNSGTYLLGHLTAVHDYMLPLLGISERLHPELEDAFIKNPDTSGLARPGIAELRKYWSEVNDAVNQGIAKISADDWFTRHTAVSEEIFQREPHRNKLNIVLNRTNHLGYHYGQLIFLQPK